MGVWFKGLTGKKDRSRLEGQPGGDRSKYILCDHRITKKFPFVVVKLQRERRPLVSKRGEKN